MGICQQDRGGKFGRAGVLKNLALRKSSMDMCFLTHRAFHGLKIKACTELLTGARCQTQYSAEDVLS